MASWTGESTVQRAPLMTSARRMKPPYGAIALT